MLMLNFRIFSNRWEDYSLNHFTALLQFIFNAFIIVLENRICFLFVVREKEMNFVHVLEPQGTWLARGKGNQ